VPGKSSLNPDALDLLLGQANLRKRMNRLKRDDVTLAFQEVGSGALPVLLVHGWACDHSFLAPQLAFFGRAHRSVAVDLRGHGMSDAPEQNYTMAGFADDLAWLCAQINLERPVVIGHSMGGNVALELAARYPELPTAIALIDSVILPSRDFIEALQPLAKALKGLHYLSALEQASSLLLLPTDSAERKSQLLASAAKTPQHVIASAFSNHVTEYDATAAIKACCVPIAYIGAAAPIGDVNRFRKICPNLITGQTIGSGHLSPLEVPDQINPMLERFVEVYAAKGENRPSASPKDVIEVDVGRGENLGVRS
jgi:pimeloyl-ACP methyl ester carboxylesterase